MADKFRKTISDVDSPAEFAYEIPDIPLGFAGTNHSINGSSIEVGVLSQTTRALYVGIAGNVYCRLANTSGEKTGEVQQANVHFQNVPAGTILPLRVQAIFANNGTDSTTNTTARGLIGLY